MAKIGKYCCFFCPSNDYTEKPIDSKCPRCGRPYNFVLEGLPATIKSFKITRSLGRGFYGSAYEAESGLVSRKYVLKISPVSFYSHFSNKDFKQEVDLHAKIAQNSEHIVGISDAFDEEIIFSDEVRSKLQCHVTVLDYVEGPVLNDIITGTTAPSAKSICQITIDLLRLRAEFEANQLNHNDLHAENLIVQQLKPAARRPDAIDDSIRVMAIDLGSVADSSKSGNARKGDLSFIATHVDLLLKRLLNKPDALEDVDFRIALALQGIINGFQTETQNLRLPNTGDLIDQIREAYYRASHPWLPWRQTLNLKSFSDHYNAQTLESWNVPALLVDPDNRWLLEVSRPGPQIITGMRGCGKTMLLRAMDIHARASQSHGKDSAQILDQIKNDRFVGLFASAQRLLDLRQQPVASIEDRLTRLFVAYSLQAVRALIHLKDIDPAAVASHAHHKLSSAVADYLENSDNLRDSLTLENLAERLLQTLVLTVNGNGGNRVKQSPSEVFSHLAESLQGCSSVFQNSMVLFLLDDVSTRYLELDKVETLLSALLFQSPTCAFKFTSEWQTIELGLKSPGRNHPIRIGRDLTVFDLGADVFETISSQGTKGKEFVARIFLQRAALLSSHPSERDPKIILGDVSLEEVAREIAAANETSGQKKRVYRGITCLTHVCVGDLGDIIKLYEDILRHGGDSASFPIAPHIQSQCFQDMCSLRLYDLNRRAGYFKDHARAFAETAHELLVRSGRISSTGSSSRPRLRQYSSIYVRITADDEKTKSSQIDQLRELIDSAVFVFSGGAPRLKTKDSNPIQQFVLSFRKIYGLAAHIGLADRDRFELSGADLSAWLNEPAKAKEILLRNQIGDEVNDEQSVTQDEDVVEDSTSLHVKEPPEKQADAVSDIGQGDLFGLDFKAAEEDAAASSQANRVNVTIRQLTEEQFSQLEIDTVLLGLGFEERTLASSRFLAAKIKPSQVYAVSYSAKGHAEQILKIWEQKSIPILQYKHQGSLASLPSSEGSDKGLLVVDVAGLTKPWIFQSVRETLASKGRVIVCHTAAAQYYPLEEDLDRLFAAKESADSMAFLESLDQVLRGEKGPYTIIRLLNDNADPSRKRVLLAFASAKHERLISLLDSREYDQIEIIAPTGDAPRAKVAKYATEFVSRSYPNTRVRQIDSSDLEGLVRYLDEEYLDFYDIGRSNLELGLTGSKMQAVAVAILSSVRKVSQAWYVSPREFDANKFSRGIGQTRIFEITTALQE